MAAMSYRVRVVGEVVGVFEREHERIAKVCLRPYCIEVNMRALNDPRLGDKVVVDGHLSVDDVTLFDGGLEGDEESHAKAPR